MNFQQMHALASVIAIFGVVTTPAEAEVNFFEDWETQNVGDTLSDLVNWPVTAGIGGIVDRSGNRVLQLTADPDLSVPLAVTGANFTMPAFLSMEVEITRIEGNSAPRLGFQSATGFYQVNIADGFIFLIKRDPVRTNLLSVSFHPGVATHRYRLDCRVSGSSLVLDLFVDNQLLSSAVDDDPVTIPGDAIAFRLTMFRGAAGSAQFDNVFVQSFSVEQFAALIRDNLVGDPELILDSDFQQAQTRGALENKLDALLDLLDAVATAPDEETAFLLALEACDKLEHDLLPKTDGFFGGNPHNDWIVTEEGQEMLYPALLNLAEALCAGL